MINEQQRPKRRQAEMLKLTGSRDDAATLCLASLNGYLFFLTAMTPLRPAS